MTIQVIPIHVKNDVQPADSLVELLLSSSKAAFEDGDVLVLVGDNTTGYIRYLNMVINGNSTTFGKNDYLFATPRPDYSTMLEVKARDVVVDNDGTTESKYCGVIVMNKTAIKDISLKTSFGW